jgi:hypothetical protein
MIREVTMYRVECDHDGCDTSPQDESDYYAWGDAGFAVDSAIDHGWTIRKGLHLCPDHGHRTVCMGDDEECPRRDKLAEADDGWMYCPDHVGQGMDSGGAP